MYQTWIAVIAVLIMAGGLGGIYYLIIKQNAVIGAKTIQFVAVIFSFPLMIVLGIDKHPRQGDHRPASRRLSGICFIGILEGVGDRLAMCRATTSAGISGLLFFCISG